MEMARGGGGIRWYGFIYTSLLCLLNAVRRFCFSFFLFFSSHNRFLFGTAMC